MTEFVGGLNPGVPVTVSDAYSDAATIGPAPNVKQLTLSVISANAAIIQCYRYTNPERTKWELETAERTVPGQSIGLTLDDCAGYKVRNAVAGANAIVLGELTLEGDVSLSNLNVTPASIDPVGNAGPGTTVTVLSTPGAGTFTLPSSAVKVKVWCVAAGGGGGGGGRSGAVGSAATGGCGGGGGATSFMEYTAAGLNALFPGGIPYTVGLGGGGGAGGAAPSAGGNGGQSKFGHQVAGGGGGGPAPSPNGGTSGAGGGISSAATTSPGSPNKVFNATGFGIQGSFPITQSSPIGPTEFGGNCGGSNAAASIGGNSLGYSGGVSMWGGPGGGGGGGYCGSTAQQKGGAGGVPASYAGVSSTGQADGGTPTNLGEFTGSGGNGGAAANTSGSKPNGTNGGNGGTGAGGGGGGGAGTGTAGAGGAGGNGQIVVVVN